MIRFDTDSDGERFQVWKQEQEMSCGVASAWMARGLVKQMSFREEEWDLAVRIYRNAVRGALSGWQGPSGPMTFNSGAFRPEDGQSSLGSTFAGFGLHANQLAMALRAEGLSVDHQQLTAAATLLTPKLGGRKAAIVGVAWNGGGKHLIVAAKQAGNGDIVFLDPWDGIIVEWPNDGTYVSDDGTSGTLIEVLYLSEPLGRSTM